MVVAGVWVVKDVAGDGLQRLQIQPLEGAHPFENQKRGITPLICQTVAEAHFAGHAPPCRMISVQAVVIAAIQLVADVASCGEFPQGRYRADRVCYVDHLNALAGAS
jgi:hypothetical protein